MRVAYRITGSVADAGDAGLRWADPGREEMRDDRARLTTVVGRLCLDRLRSAAARRERFVGPWLPEPFVTETDALSGHHRNPCHAVLLCSVTRMTGQPPVS